jgi:hypothetical protein
MAERRRMNVARPTFVRRALLASASSAHGKRSTRSRSSRRRTTWDSRGLVALVWAARAVIRKVRCGASDSMARTKYSESIEVAPRRI